MYRDYEKRRFKRNRLNLPRAVELGLMLEIANVFYREGDAEQRNSWMDKARLDAAGLPDLQQRIKECQVEAREFSVLEELFPRSSSEPASVGSETGERPNNLLIPDETDQRCTI